MSRFVHFAAGLVLGLVVGATPCAGGQTVEVLAGAGSYRPALGDIRDVLVLEDESDRALSIAARSIGKDYWTEVGWTRYHGSDPRGIFDLRVDAVSGTYLVALGKAVRPLLGLGTDLLFMRRDAGLESTSNDILWGAHSTAGLAVYAASWLSAELRWTYLWSRQSTFDGTEYDLGDAFWSLRVGLGI